MRQDERGPPRPKAGKILVIRNDRLGDFMLAWPALALLRASLPGSRLFALVPRYAADLALHCPSVDGILADPGQRTGPRAALEMTRRIRQLQFDAAIALFSTARNALMTSVAGIPYRLAPATKVAQVLYTHRLSQRRSRSVKPEWEYNTDLARAFLAHVGAAPAAFGPPFLRFPAAETARLRDGWCGTQGIDPDRFLVVLHPGSGGSSPTLPPEAFALIGSSLRLPRRHAIMVSAGPGERPLADRVVALLAERGTPAGVLQPGGGLVGLARHLAFAELFLSGSTGPLHIAGALDRPTVAFYPRTPAASSRRWQTVNSSPRRLAFEPPAEADPDAVAAIDPILVAEAISRWLSLASPGASLPR